MPDNVVDREVEILDSVVIRNLRILERALIPNTPPLADPLEEEVGHYFVSLGERRHEGPDAIISAVSIRYDTKTGDIVRTPDYKDPSINDGDYSQLRTYLVGGDEHVTFNEKMKRWDTTPGKYKLLLAYPNGWLTPHVMGAAVAEKFSEGSGIDPLVGEGNWILPERILPASVREYGQNIMGTSEQWGKSNFVNKPADRKIFQAIEAFNKKHGPSLEEQLFRGVKVIAPMEGGSPRSILEFFSKLTSRLTGKRSR